MAYTPTNWKAGDTVTSAKLNKMEQGIANGSGTLIVHMINGENASTLDKTWQEIYDAAPNVILYDESPVSAQQIQKNLGYLTAFDNSSGSYKIYWLYANSYLQRIMFITTTAQSPNDYPISGHA